MTKLTRREILGRVLSGAALTLAGGAALNAVTAAHTEEQITARWKAIWADALGDALNKKTGGSAWKARPGKDSIVFAERDVRDGNFTYTETLRFSGRTARAQYSLGTVLNRWEQAYDEAIIFRDGSLEIYGTTSTLSRPEIGVRGQIPAVTGKLDFRTYIRDLGLIVYESGRIVPGFESGMVVRAGRTLSGFAEAKLGL